MNFFRTYLRNIRFMNLHKQDLREAVVVFLFFLISTPALALSMLNRFDHDMHLEKIFRSQGIECSHCHNFSLDPATKKLIPNENLEKSAFHRPLKNICHECHQSTEAKHKDAPKSCFNCHRSMQSLRAIQPKNHENIEWKGSHSTAARVGGQACLECHMTSQCVKCHQRRNDVELSNHSRNFRFFHSVQARAQPGRCDTCHSKSFCVNCHLGKQ